MKPKEYFPQIGELDEPVILKHKPTCLNIPPPLSPLPPPSSLRPCPHSIVFVLNHASPDDFQPFTLRETHLLLADHFQGAKFSINGGLSLLKSGIVPVGKGFPLRKGPKSNDNIDPGDVNIHLLPTNTSATDTFGIYTASKPENTGAIDNSTLENLQYKDNLCTVDLPEQIFR